MRYFIILLAGSFIIFSPLYTWADTQHEGQKQEFKAHDPTKDPQAHQNKDGFPTGPGCSVPEDFFKNLDKMMHSNPCAPDTYNPCNPCSAKAVPLVIPKVGEN